MAMVVVVEDGQATIEPGEGNTANVARALLAAANNVHLVKTVRVKGKVGFRVPEWVSEKAFRVDSVQLEAEAHQPDVPLSIVPSSALPESLEADEPVVDEQPTAPRRNGSTAAWRAFLDALGIPYPEDAQRDDLILAWEG